MLEETNNFKIDLLLTLDQNLTSMESPDKLIIHTSDGIILGRLAYKDDFKYDEKTDNELIEKDRNNKIFFSTARQTLENYREEKYVNSDNKSASPKGIWLKNVVIDPNNPQPINVSYYFLFFEQVIGVTAGSFEEN